MVPAASHGGVWALGPDRITTTGAWVTRTPGPSRASEAVAASCQAANELEAVCLAAELRLPVRLSLHSS
eukprot:3143837-Rhodomonas_salina.1